MKLLPLFLMLFIGCSTTPMTEQDMAEYLYNKQASKDVKDERIRALLIACTCQMTLYIDTRNISSTGLARLHKRANKDAGYPYIPRGLHLSDVACLTPYELKRLLEQVSRGY